MQRIYGYCRISTKQQNIERQERNILAAYPSARITKEIYTGTKISRKGLDKILKEAQSGDIIVFDSVSRMSRSAAEGVELYMQLFATRQIELAFAQSQKEVDDLRQRTAEGIETARRNGKRIGTPKGSVLNVKKKAPAKAFIKKHSRKFGGELNDTQCAAAAKISRMTFYRYAEELREELCSEK